jgi:hypothetical protein
MPHDFFEATPKQQNVILVDAATLREAERLIKSCEHCNPVGVDQNILDRIIGSDPSVTDYVLEQRAKCPNCRHDIFENTLIEPGPSGVGFYDNS